MRIPERFYEERHYLLHVALLSFAIGVALLFLGERIAAIEKRSTSAMDDFLKYRPKSKSEKIAIVSIDEAAFHSADVGARQPMSRAYLANVITALTAARPRAIAIDIDLSSNQPDQDRMLSALKAAEKNGVRVVISYRLSQHEAQTTFIQRLSGRQNEQEISPEMLKFRSEMEKHGFDTGYVNLNYESGIVRKMMPIPEIVGAGFPVSLPVAVLSACSGNAPSQNSSHDVFVRVDGCFGAKGKLNFDTGELERINFTNTFPYYSTGFVLHEKAEVLRQILQGRIVFLGETFEKSEDVHHTPLDGSAVYDHGMQGVELLAHSANTLIENRRIRPVPPVLALLIDCVIGFALGVIFVFYGVTRRTAIVSGAAVMALAILVSFPILALWDHWFDYAATAVGVTIHRIYEKRKATGISRHLTDSFEGRDLMDILIKTLDVSEKRAFIVAAEIQNLWNLSKNFPESNGFQIARYWRDLGSNFKTKFPQAHVFSDHRIIAVFPEQEGMAEILAQSAAFLLRNLEEMNQLLAKQIKAFPGLRLGIGIDQHQESMVSTIGNACGLAQRASNYSAEVLVTEIVYEQMKKLANWSECGEMKMNQTSIRIFKMVDSASLKMEPVS